MSYNLTGTRYIGTGSLPVPAAGFDAIDTTTGNFYVCNAAGTVWNLVGNVNNVNLGLLPLTGGTMNGSITGATGWAPNDSPNFTSSAKLDGVNLATTSDLSTTSTTILNSIAPKITEAVASTTSNISTKANVAMSSGVLTFTAGFGTSDSTTNPPQVIPLPTYPDGTVAAESDCKWIVSLVKYDGAPAAPSLRYTNGLATSWGNVDANIVDPMAVRTFNATLYNSSVGLPCKVGYLIIGVRP